MGGCGFRLTANSPQSLALAHGVSLAAPGANPARHRGLVQAVAAARSMTELPETKLGQQLSTVLSALRAGGFNQQAFMVPLAGFETVQDQLTRQAALFAELDGALVAFYRAVSKLGLAEGVTVYTDTEFNRTLVPNKSGGSDHAWGGHQLVLGGSALGGQIYGRFPTSGSKWRRRRRGQWNVGAFGFERAVCGDSGVLVWQDYAGGCAGICGVAGCDG